MEIDVVRENVLRDPRKPGVCAEPRENLALAVDAEHNVNWVYDFGGVGLGLPGWWQLILVGLGLPLVVYLPSHLLFGAVFGRSFAGEVEK